MESSCIRVGANHPDLAACRQNERFPPAASTCNSPPHCAKDSAMENIHRQLLGTSRSHLTPTPVHDSGLVPRFIAIACLVNPVHQGSYAN